MNDEPDSIREDWEAFWDGEPRKWMPRHALTTLVGVMGVIMVAACVRLAARDLLVRKRRIIPSAADIHVRYPPPR